MITVEDFAARNDSGNTSFVLQSSMALWAGDGTLTEHGTEVKEKLEIAFRDSTFEALGADKDEPGEFDTNCAYLTSPYLDHEEDIDRLREILADYDIRPTHIQIDYSAGRTWELHFRTSRLLGDEAIKRAETMLQAARIVRIERRHYPNGLYLLIMSMTSSVVPGPHQIITALGGVAAPFITRRQG